MGPFSILSVEAFVVVASSGFGPVGYQLKTLFLGRTVPKRWGRDGARRELLNGPFSMLLVEAFVVVASQTRYTECRSLHRMQIRCPLYLGEVLGRDGAGQELVVWPFPMLSVEAFVVVASQTPFHHESIPGKGLDLSGFT